MRLKKSLNRFMAVSLAAIMTFAMAGCDNVDLSEYLPEETTQIETTTVAVEETTAAPKPVTEADPQAVAAFDEYLDQLFIDSMGDDAFSIHYTLKDYKSYGIEEISHSMGEISAEAILEGEAQLEQYIEDLSQFDPEKLTERQQLTLKTLLAYYKKKAAFNGYSLIENQFGPNSGFIANLSVNFIEFVFDSEEDVELYLDLLKDTDNYTEQLLDFVKEQADAGYFMSNYCVDQNVEMIDKYFDIDVNPLIASFDEKVDALDISDSKKAEYKALNAQYIEEHYDVAYANIKDTLISLKDKTENEQGMCYFEGGKEYYTAVVREKTATSMTPDEVIAFLDDAMDDLLYDVRTMYFSDASIEDDYENFEVDMDDPTEILEFLAKNCTQDFPRPYTKDFVVNYQSKACEVEGTLAYYLTARIDQLDYNSIKVNGSAFEDQPSVSLYTTLAHEGFPGHLYQFTGVIGNDEIHNAAKIVDFIGFTEGYAEYASDMALSFVCDSEDLADFIALNDLYGYIIESRCDLGINYEGWTKEYMRDYLSEYGIPATSSDSIYDTLQADPGLLLPYTVGHVLLRQYREKAEAILGDSFNPVDYNKMIINCGFVDFDIFEEEFIKYVDEHK